MRDLDPHLMRLREVEARIALAEIHVRTQQEVVDRLDAGGLDARLAGELLTAMRRTLELFLGRQKLILRELTRHQVADAGSAVRLKPAQPRPHGTGVDFEVWAQGQAVRCFVSADVLARNFGAAAGDERSLLDAFHGNEQEIEAAATRCCARPHGRVVVVTDAELGPNDS